MELLLSIAAKVINVICDILPDSPITEWLEDWTAQSTAIAQGFRWLNWLVDIDAMLAVMALWLAAIAAYYAMFYGISVIGGLKSWIRNFVTTLVGE